ncbi:MAG TPA: PP2C family protein-serine/threonine phosphatase [Pilimelia sp.]|nr:PP2C family protein-serine/threonine phosphatase [Pilimelia sp.]
MDDGADLLWHEALVDLLHRTRMCQPDEVAGHVSAAAARMGLEVTIYLVDHEQLSLRALPEHAKPTPDPLPVDDGAAGEAFTLVKTVQAGGGNELQRLWVPLIDGAERLGVADVRVSPNLPVDAPLIRRCETLIGLAGHLVATKLPYGDALHIVRRSRPMSTAAELLLPLLPPLTFSCERLVVSAVLEPAYEVGGDAFDYAVDGSNAYLAILDAMGRGLSAGLAAAVALSALRAARRAGQDLPAMVAAADEALSGEFGEARFVTGVVARLDLDTGLLRYVNAGHPEPVLLRSGRVVDQLAGGRRLPFGLRDATPHIGATVLQPMDRLLFHTDGVVEARGADGRPFGVDRLVHLTEEHAAAALPAPETLRRLAHSVLAHQQGPPIDDATLLLLDWSSSAAERTQP